MQPRVHVLRLQSLDSPTTYDPGHGVQELVRQSVRRLFVRDDSWEEFHGGQPPRLSDIAVQGQVQAMLENIDSIQD